MEIELLCKGPFGVLYLENEYLCVLRSGGIWFYGRHDHELKHCLKKAKAQGVLHVLDDHRVLTVDKDGKYRIYDYTTGEELWKGGIRGGYNCTIDPLLSEDGSKIYDLKHFGRDLRNNFITVFDLNQNEYQRIPVPDCLPGTLGLYTKAEKTSFLQAWNRDDAFIRRITCFADGKPENVLEEITPPGGDTLTAFDGKYAFYSHSNTLRNVFTQEIYKLCGNNPLRGQIPYKLRLCRRHIVCFPR